MPVSLSLLDPDSLAEDIYSVVHALSCAEAESPKHMEELGNVAHVCKRNPFHCLYYTKSGNFLENFEGTSTHVCLIGNSGTRPCGKVDPLKSLGGEYPFRT